MKILIAGDFSPRSRTTPIIESENYEALLGDAKNKIEDADYAIVNFETAVVEDHNIAPITKCGSFLKCSTKAVDAIKYAGFNAVTLANNHVMDYGTKGLNRTLSICKKKNIDVVGAGSNISEAGKILYKKLGDKTVAIINCCEHEFSIASEFNPGSNPLNPIQQYYSICEAREKADYVIVIVHGGHEHFQLPSPRMQETYKFFIDCGADAVINHHQHCYSGYEVYQGKPIFYGLGNFCFDKDSAHTGIWTEGYMVNLSLNENKIGFELIPYRQCAEIPNVALLVDKQKEDFNKKICSLNEIIANPQSLEKEFQKWLQGKTNSYMSHIGPFQDKITRTAVSRGYLPHFLSRNKVTIMLNVLMCESHLDCILRVLKTKIK